MPARIKADNRWRKSKKGIGEGYGDSALDGNGYGYGRYGFRSNKDVDSGYSQTFSYGNAHVYDDTAGMCSDVDATKLDPLVSLALQVGL